MAPPALPPELHSLIIRIATYSPACFDASPDARSWPELERGITTEYQTKKALTLVSSQFLSISLPYLYEVVQVRKSSSMHRLANVLDVTSFGASTSGLRSPRKVEYLFVSTWVFHDGKTEVALFSSLERVLSRCVGLQGFGFYSATPQLMKHNWMTAIPKGVRFVDWNGLIMSLDFTQIVDSISESLTSLRFSKVRVKQKSPSATLPKLTHLSVPEEYDLTVLYDWSMPSLTHLHVKILSSVTLMRVVEHFGNSLRSATLGAVVERTLLTQLATTAQNLEGCTYHFRIGMIQSWQLVRSHPSLQSIVVLVSCFIEGDNEAWLQMSAFCCHLQPLTVANFPKLRRIRFVGFHPSFIRYTKAGARLDELLDAWNLSGVEVRFLEVTDNYECFMFPL
ncbi:hypothetical protein BD410DRAFT_900391 [Rickenella mellea]|uniref:F-box domain-containing protein n=1 Tax=Rickenella mellea TaxID=50990 RepID=A0A4Y7PUX0_9AGAM|nr:hypothetical protein BD410DRAFT_900391 [Rickenella mellea]